VWRSEASGLVSCPSWTVKWLEEQASIVSYSGHSEKLVRGEEGTAICFRGETTGVRMVSRKSSRAKLSEAKAGMQLGRGRCTPSRRGETTTLVVLGDRAAWVLAVDRDVTSGGGGGGGGGGC